MSRTKENDDADDLPRVRGSNEVRLISFGAGAVAVAAVLLAAPGWLRGTPRLVAAYDAGSLVLIALLWALAIHGRAGLTKARAAVEDPGRNLVFLTVVVCGLIGVVSAISILGFGPHVSTKSEKYIAQALAIGAVVTGWILIHTTYTLRYAHLYYFDSDGDHQSDAGLQFPGSAEPSDYDFAYFAFVVGMTFQVSDVQVVDPTMRRLVLSHGLISFAYNTAIIALVVNIASSLLHS